MAKKKCLLFVDDDEVMLEGLRITFEEEGYSVVTSTDSQSILSTIDSCNPSVVVVDYRMPGNDGVQVTRIIKKNKSFKSVPVIMLSASKGAEKIAEAAGADGFLEKPFELEDLISMVGKYAK